LVAAMLTGKFRAAVVERVDFLEVIVDLSNLLG
jgi:hypothetical protein